MGRCQLPRLCLKILAVPCHSGRPPQLRGQLSTETFAFVAAPTVFLFPEEQPGYGTQGPCPHPVPAPSPATGRKRFVGPAVEERAEELIDGDQNPLAVGHASTPGQPAPASIAWANVLPSPNAKTSRPRHQETSPHHGRALRPHRRG